MPEGFGSTPWIYYTVAPAGSTCAVALGNSIAVDLTAPAGTGRIASYWPGSAVDTVAVSCPYIDEARAAAPDAGVPAADCSPKDGELATRLEAGEPWQHLALVVGPATGVGSGKKAVALCTYTGDAAGGTSTSITCTLPAGQEAVCLAALAFFLAQRILGAGVVAGLTTQLRNRLLPPAAGSASNPRFGAFLWRPPAPTESNPDAARRLDGRTAVRSTPDPVAAVKTKWRPAAHRGVDR